MSYALDDFTESLEKVGLDPLHILCVVAAWGENGDCAEWQGGFLMRAEIEGKGRPYVYLSGWCDTSGWG